LTLDTVYHLDDNWFGAGIITNARILSRDTLNRCLADSASVAWFVERAGSVEALQVVGTPEIAALACRDQKTIQGVKSIVFPLASGSADRRKEFRFISTQKIGVIEVKNTELDIYNIYAQLVVMHSSGDGSFNRRSVVTLGNLNTSGLIA